MKSISFSALVLAALVSSASAQIAEKVNRSQTGGFDLVACKTDVQDVVTFHGSLPAGDSFAPANNRAIPTLAGEMLDKGTTKQDKFAIAQKLDQIGAHIDFSVSGVMVEFRGKCLRKDLSTVIGLLAEQIRTPAFAEDEFAKLKKQLLGDLQRAQESTSYRADQAFSEAIFPAGHPNYSPPVKEFMAAIEAADLADVKTFHANYYGPTQSTFVVVGDFDLDELKRDLAQAFAGWTGGKAVSNLPRAESVPKTRSQTIQMADKPNVTVVMGQADHLRYSDQDSLALRVGTAVLGSGFTGRLMANVRDKEGLTYGIGAGMADDAFTDGAWQISANFAPDLLEKGIASTQNQLDVWYKDGVTTAELERVKTNLIGTFKVGLATTDGMASALLNAIHRGYNVNWLDEYPKRVQALTLAEVNAAIKAHLKPQEMTVIKAGTVPPATSGN
ncbi:MAG: pitrilysin family protein [Chthoniobacterales bacterium]